MTTPSTTHTEATAATHPSLAAPPPPVPPPDLVRLRVDVPGIDYRQVRHLAIDTSTSVNELFCEALRLLIRYYGTGGLHVVPHYEGGTP